MPIIRKQLKPSDVYPDTIRYDPLTDQVEVLIDGEWTPSPESDPRRQTTLPPRITSDTACDAAQSIVDALKGQIDSILVAIDNGSTAFTIAGIILSLLSFGVFAVFISIALTIADAMLAAGTGALSAALTEPVYDQLKCILVCKMNSSGRIIPGQLAVAQSEVSSEIGGLAATIINSMLSLAGEGGINNLASLGTSTGDCSACGCAVGLVPLTGVPAAPGTINEVAPGIWHLTSTERAPSGSPSVISYTVYVQMGDLSCWAVTAASLVSGSFIGGTSGSNCPGVEWMSFSPEVYHLDTPAGVTAVNGQNLKWAGWRSEAPFTVSINIEPCP